MAMSFGGASVFFLLPAQSQMKVSIAILSTVNENKINDQLIKAFYETGDVALADIHVVKAVSYPTKASSIAPSETPSQSPPFI